MSAYIHSPDLTATQKQHIETTLAGTLTAYHTHHRIETTADANTCQQLSQELGIDINRLPASFDPTQVKLILSDMDSTLISIECVDEIADFAGLKPQVAAITEQAMQGKLDFDQSLTKRVALLAGLPTDTLETVYQERLRLNLGAETLITTSQTMGIAFALVSGGFTFFTDKLHHRLKLNFSRANTLGTANGQLTGTVEGAIINAQAKAAFLQELCAQLGIQASQVVAMGDGANDLAMMRLAGLSVAYRAKPAVQAKACVQLNYAGLDAVLDLLTP